MRFYLFAGSIYLAGFFKVTDYMNKIIQLFEKKRYPIRIELYP